jgi:PAS domain S-box-containing protein
METRVSAYTEHYHAPFDVHLDVHVIAIPEGVALHYRDVSDRKRAEAERDATTSRLNQVLEVTSDGIVSLDRNWRYSFVNQRAAELLGRDDLQGKTVWEEFPYLVDSEFSRNMRRSMEERVATEFEAWYPEPLENWLSLQIRPSEDGIVIFFRDITERKLSENIFRQQRDLITFVQQASRTAFWNLDLATGNLSFDVGSYPVFGHDLSTLTAVPAFRAIVHPDDRAEVTANVVRAVETGELIVNEFRVIDPKGSIVWLEARSQTQVVDGKAVTLGGMTIDISERKRNQEALASSEQRYRVLTELSPQFLWMGSPDGHITYANQGFLDYLGFSLDDIGGEKWLMAFDPEDRASVRESWGRSITTGEVYEIEARLIEGMTGQSKWWWLRGLPLRSEAGVITDWLGVAVDIHDRKTAADALHQKQLETERQRAELETVYRRPAGGRGTGQTAHRDRPHPGAE